MERKAKGKP